MAGIPSQLKTSVLISNTSLQYEVIIRESPKVGNTFFWHKIFVTNALRYDRDYVLESIMKYTYPSDFSPVNYKIECDKITFLLNSCGEAIDKLLKANLVVYHGNTAQPFNLAVMLCYDNLANLRIHDQSVAEAVRSRYDPVKSVLNLDNFNKDPRLINFCSLAQPNLLSSVLQLCKPYRFITLILTNNKIEFLSPLDALVSKFVLKHIDVRNNLIRNANELCALKAFQLESLNLEGNPLCSYYISHQYVKMIRDVCPLVTTVDGVSLSTSQGIAMPDNYLCDGTEKNFVDKFLEHFFTLYDTSRATLAEIYHKEAMISMSAKRINRPTLSKNYLQFSRNIRAITDFSKNDELLFNGIHSITNLLGILPRTKHDPSSFKVDLVISTSTMKVLTISGVFTHSHIQKPTIDELLNFSRTLILLVTEEGELKIMNEMVNISNASANQHESAFAKSFIPINYTVPNATSNTDREEMIKGLQVLTNLKVDWAKKCLHDVGYDLGKALQIFTSLFESEQIPTEAFREDLLLRDEQSLEADDVSSESSYSVSDDEKPRSSSSGITAGVFEPNAQMYDGPMENAQTHHDPVLQAAVDMPAYLNPYEKLGRLLAAADLVLRTYTLELHFYRKLGTEFFKLGFLEEGRKFLKDAMNVLPANKSEEIYSSFTLYEVRFGDKKIAKNMVLAIVETFAIQKAVKFLRVYLPNCDIEFGWKMFQFLKKCDLPPYKKEKIIFAGKRFRMEYKQNLVGLSGKVKRTMKYKKKKRHDQNKKKDYIQLHNALLHERESFERKLQEKLNNLDKLHPFTEFRHNLLVKADILKDSNDEPDIEEWINSKETIERRKVEGLRLLEKYSNRPYTLRSLFNKYLEDGDASDLILSNVLSEEQITGLKLNVVFQVSTSLKAEERGNYFNAVIDFVEKSDALTIIDFFEDIIRSKAVIGGDLFKCCTAKDLPREKKSLLISLYRSYARSTKNELLTLSSNSLVDFTDLIDTFHPFDALTNSYAAKNHVEYMHFPQGQLPLNIIRESGENHRDSLKVQVESLRGLYYHGYLDEARKFSAGAKKVMNIKNTIAAEINKFNVGIAYYEATYGDSFETEIDNVTGEFNKFCLRLHRLVVMENIAEAKSLLTDLFHDVDKVINPDVQELLYKYHCDWVDNFDINLFC